MSSKNAQNSQKSSQEMIGLGEAAFMLRLSDNGLEKLLKERKVLLGVDLQGKPVMTRDSFRSLAYTDKALSAAFEALACVSSRRMQDRDSGLDVRFARKSEEAITRYHPYISRLAEIHKSYQDSIDCLREESGRVAAYVIYAKVIRLLNLALLGLEHSRWDVFVLLRPIDEAIDLAKYFALCSAEEPAAGHLREWFRENQSPKHAIVRKVWGKKLDALLELSEGNLERLSGQLYHKKSKELHHTFNGMWENFETGMIDGTLKVIGFGYGDSPSPRNVGRL